MMQQHCAVCGMPIVDTISVNEGMGPDCREKAGMDIDVSPEARSEANKLVYQIAEDRKHGKRNADAWEAAIARINALGFTTLGALLSSKLTSLVETATKTAKIVLTEKDGRIAVKSPWCAAALDGFRALPGRRWDAANKCNTIPATPEAKRALLALLRTHYAGKHALGAKGVFTL
jgi:uncharacterized Zn finger protein (UPF0148 family)